MVDKTPPNRGREARRRFLASLAGAACGATLVASGVGLYARQARAHAPGWARPPGALDEGGFLAACVRCGQCVRACPYDALKLAELGEPVPTGTPYFEPRKVPCEMCSDIPCVPACPTGALDHELKEIDKARMGLAVLVDQETCLNFQGLRCDVCYRVCPAIDKAITLEPRHNPRTGKHTMFIPTVHSEHCTGCGKCEKSCVLDESAIKVFPLAQAKARMGGHYRLGWEEKRKAGAGLVPEPLQLPARRPE
jgi:ferredoxin-type protein NapG